MPLKDYLFFDPSNLIISSYKILLILYFINNSNFSKIIYKLNIVE